MPLSTLNAHSGVEGRCKEPDGRHTKTGWTSAGSLRFDRKEPERLDLYIVCDLFVVCKR